MKKIKYLIVLAIIAGLCSPIMAVQGNSQIDGDVAAINTIEIQESGDNIDELLDNMHNQDIPATVMFRYKISNNHIDGWKVDFSSGNAGKEGNLVLYDANQAGVSYGSNFGEYIPYTVTTQATESGTLNNGAFHGFFNDSAHANNTGSGHDSPPYNLKDVSLATQQTVTYDLSSSVKTNGRTATHAFYYDVLIDPIEKEELFAGTYKDTLTLTLSDL